LSKHRLARFFCAKRQARTRRGAAAFFTGLAEAPHEAGA
jgi:hypothetical protein